MGETTNNTSYEDILYHLQLNSKAGLIAYLEPNENQIYDFDLDTRTITVPQFLSVRYDHNSEVVYFRCPRYYNDMDLTDTTCVIRYINANGDVGVYCVPYFDISHFDEDTPLLLIPWMINGLVAASAGTITFSIQFYVLNETKDEDTGKYGYIYNLNSQPASGAILHGVELSDEEMAKFDLEASVVEEVYAYLQQAISESTVYWYDA